MRVIQVPVTGKELKEQLTPQMKALSEFYQALNGRDLELMAQNWTSTDDDVMDNPLGGVTRGWDEIKAVYERFFSSSGQYWFEFYDYSYHEAGEIFYVAGRERGEYRAGEGMLNMAIRTTRIFWRISGEWRQIHHPGSIEDSQQLAAYQKAVSSSA
jgi:hypothetical protein